MFESPFNKTQSSSLFSSPLTPADERINQLYQEMEYLKNQQNVKTPQRNVFSDIQEEMANLSLDERKFIETSNEYLEASQKYQSDFSMFLMDYLGPDFLRSSYGKSPEVILAVIRKKKDEYKNEVANNISQIRDQSNNLAQQNNELAKTNVELQKQLSEIQKQLGGLKNAI